MAEQSWISGPDDRRTRSQMARRLGYAAFGLTAVVLAIVVVVTS